MFRGGEAEIRTIAGHNVHENVSRFQEGGTAAMLYGSLIEQYDYEHSGKDGTGLGRWVVMVLRGSEGVVTRIVVGYNPCSNNKKASRTFYQQNRRYFIKKEKDETCPRERFRQDLVQQLKAWRDQGDRLIVCLDANQHIYREGIGRELADANGLDMKEVVGSFTGKQLGATYFRGKRPIDGVWATRDVEIAGACVMPAGYGVGDHRLFVIDVMTSSIVGHTPPKIVRAAARRLNTAIPGALDKYIKQLEGHCVNHRLTERLVAANAGPTKELIRYKVNKIDVEATQYMANAEAKCRKIKSGRIPFSPESSLWIRRCQLYRSILRFHAGKIKNKANLKRTARRCKVSNPLRMSLNTIHSRLREAKGKCKYFQRHGRRYRKKHLQERLEKARTRKDEEAEVRILAIIQREKDRAYWRKLNYSLSSRRS